MDWIKFDRITGEGENALYNLYIDGQRVGDALTMAEIIAALSEVWDKPPRPFEFATEKRVEL